VTRPRRLRPALVGEVHRHRRIAVDAVLHVEGGMRVADQDKELQTPRLRDVA